MKTILILFAVLFTTTVFSQSEKLKTKKLPNTIFKKSLVIQSDTFDFIVDLKILSKKAFKSENYASFKQSVLEIDTMDRYEDNMVNCFLGRGFFYNKVKVYNKVTKSWEESIEVKIKNSRLEKELNIYISGSNLVFLLRRKWHVNLPKDCYSLPSYCYLECYPLGM